MNGMTSGSMELKSMTSGFPLGVLQLDNMQYASSAVDSDNLQSFSEFNGFTDSTAVRNDTTQITNYYSLPLDDGLGGVHRGIEQYEVPVSLKFNAENDTPSKTQSVEDSNGRTIHTRPRGK